MPTDLTQNYLLKKKYLLQTLAVISLAIDLSCLMMLLLILLLASTGNTYMLGLIQSTAMKLNIITALNMTKLASFCHSASPAKMKKLPLQLLLHFSLLNLFTHLSMFRLTSLTTALSLIVAIHGFFMPRITLSRSLFSIPFITPKP